MYCTIIRNSIGVLIYKITIFYLNYSTSSYMKRSKSNETSLSPNNSLFRWLRNGFVEKDDINGCNDRSKYFNRSSIVFSNDIFIVWCSRINLKPLFRGSNISSDVIPIGSIAFSINSAPLLSVASLNPLEFLIHFQKEDKIVHLTKFYQSFQNITSSLLLLSFYLSLIANLTLL